MRRLLLAIALLLVALGPSAAEARETRMTAQATYELGEKYLRRGLLLKAQEQFERVRTYFRDDPYALRAELAIAELQWKRDEWDQARLAYEDFMRSHPRYRELDYVVYRYGGTMFKKAPNVAARDQTWTRQALNAWASFDSRFPGSEWSDEVHADLTAARDRLAHKELLIARFYAQREADVSVAGRVEGLLADFPDSPDRFEALYLGGVAWAGMGQVDKAATALQRLRTEAPQSTWTERLEHELKDVALPAGAPPASSASTAPATGA
jgi:outer membrane protein assembly factor BamD